MYFFVAKQPEITLRLRGNCNFYEIQIFLSIDKFFVLIYDKNITGNGSACAIGFYCRIIRSFENITEKGKYTMSEKKSLHPEFSQQEPDYVLELDISSVKSLQVGYHGETVFLHKSEGNTFLLKEYIAGLNGSEYFAKVSANRFKTTIRYGRREEVNYDTYVEVFIPADWHGEFSVSSQYGNIFTEEDWEFERFSAETAEGSITMKKVTAPRIHLVTSVRPIQIERAEGFADLHSVSGSIRAGCVEGGGNFKTSDSPIQVMLASLNNVAEFSTIGGDMEISLPKEGGLDVDGISKTGTITSEIEGLTVRTKPGNICNVSGILREKPFQKVRISSINGNVFLHA